MLIPDPLNHPRDDVIGAAVGDAGRQAVRSLSRARAATVLIAAFALVQAGLPTNAHAEESSASKITEGRAFLSDVERAQIPLVEAADTLQVMGTGGDLSGFAGVAIDVEEQLVKLYWKDALAAAAVDVISTLESSVAVEAITVPYSQDELLAEAYRIAQDNLDTVTGVGPTPDFA